MERLKKIRTETSIDIYLVKVRISGKTPATVTTFNKPHAERIRERLFAQYADEVNLDDITILIKKCQHIIVSEDYEGY